MSVTTILKKSSTRNLVSLDRVKTELSITGSAEDARLSTLIAEASSAIETMTRRKFARETVTDRFAGNGRTIYCVDLFPVVELIETRYSGDVVTTEILIASTASGSILNRYGWTESNSRARAVLPEQLDGQPYELPWEVDYTYGFLLPDHDVTLGTIEAAVDGDVSTLVFASEDDVPPLVPNDWITTSGFSTAANNRQMKVTAVDGAEVTVDATLTAEAAGQSVTIACANLPLDLGKEALNIVVNAYKAAGRDPTITAEKLGDWSASYSREAVSKPIVNEYKVTF